MLLEHKLNTAGSDASLSATGLLPPHGAGVHAKDEPAGGSPMEQENDGAAAKRARM